jgi:hypothetical protein
MSSASTLLPESSAPEQVARTVEPVLEASDVDTAGLRSAATSFSFSDHHGFERRLNMAGRVNSSSKVFISICELGVFGGQVKPFQGLASMEVHNVVPHDDGIVIVRGFIGWDSDINVRLSVFVA